MDRRYRVTIELLFVSNHDLRVWIIVSVEAMIVLHVTFVYFSILCLRQSSISTMPQRRRKNRGCRRSVVEMFEEESRIGLAKSNILPGLEDLATSKTLVCCVSVLAKFNHSLSGREQREQQA